MVAHLDEDLLDRSSTIACDLRFNIETIRLLQICSVLYCKYWYSNETCRQDSACALGSVCTVMVLFWD